MSAEEKQAAAKQTKGQQGANPCIIRFEVI